MKKLALILAISLISSAAMATGSSSGGGIVPPITPIVVSSPAPALALTIKKIANGYEVSNSGAGITAATNAYTNPSTNAADANAAAKALIDKSIK